MKRALLLLGLCLSSAFASDVCESHVDGARLPHPWDCNKFLVCGQGRTVAISACPNGLHFNSEFGECDLRGRAGCEVLLSWALLADECDCNTACACCDICKASTNAPITTTTSIPPTAPEKTTTSATTTTDKPTTTTTKPTTAPTTTPTGPTTTTTKPTTGTTQPTTTTTAKATTTTIKPTTAPTTPPTGPTTTTTRLTTGTTQPTITTKPTAAPPSPTLPAPGTPTSFCSNDLDDCVGKYDNTVLRYQGDCNRYIVCVGSCAAVMRCPNNLRYNLDSGVCDYPQHVDCPWASVPPSGPAAGPSGTSCTNPGKCAGQENGVMFAADDASDGYVVCECECEVAMACPSNLVFNETAGVCDYAAGAHSVKCPDGLVYNATADACDWPEGVDGQAAILNVKCNNDETICENKNEGELFPVDGVCNKFYECNFGCAVEHVCPNNLIYNSVSQNCDYPQNFKCPWPYTPPFGPSAGPSGIQCADAGRCANADEGTLFASNNSCGKYVVCRCDCEVERDCPAGLYFDETIQACNYPDELTVKCEI